MKGLTIKYDGDETRFYIGDIDISSIVIVGGSVDLNMDQPTAFLRLLVDNIELSDIDAEIVEYVKSDQFTT